MSGESHIMEEQDLKAHNSEQSCEDGYTQKHMARATIECNRAKSKSIGGTSYAIATHENVDGGAKHFQQKKIRATNQGRP